MKLYEIVEIYQNLIELDLEEEDLQQHLQNIDDEFFNKAENIAKVIRTLELDVESYKEEEKRLYNKRKTIENKVHYLKKYLEDAMIQTNNRKFKKGTFSFNIQKNPAGVNITHEDLLPEDYYYFEKKIDKRALITALKDGTEISGAELKQTESLRIR